MAKTTLDSLEYRHSKPLAKRGAPVKPKSTEFKSFDSPIDMTGDVMGKRATSKVAKAHRNEVHPLPSDNNPVGRGGSGGRGPQISPYRSYMKTAAPVKKDIGAGFVPSIGVKLGKKTDVQAPAKNLMPPYESPAQKSASASMKKDITAAGFVPSIGVGSGKKKHDGMPSTFIVPSKKKK